MENVVSVSTNDGQSEILKAEEEPRYKINTGELNSKLPKPPNDVDLSKLFAPKYVANVKAPDGTIIPFTYKKLDSGSMLATIGMPLGVNIHPLVATERLQKKAEALGIDLDKPLEIEVDDPKFNEKLDLMSGEEIVEIQRFNEHVRRETLKLSIISPQITDDIYDDLDEEVKEGLYQLVSGGVTNDKELVEFFRDKTKRA